MEQETDGPRTSDTTCADVDETFSDQQRSSSHDAGVLISVSVTNVTSR
jgi:hypothetical protein